VRRFDGFMSSSRTGTIRSIKVAMGQCFLAARKPTSALAALQNGGYLPAASADILTQVSFNIRGRAARRRSVRTLPNSVLTRGEFRATQALEGKLRR